MLSIMLDGTAVVVAIALVIGLWVHFSDNGITIPWIEYALVLVVLLVPANFVVSKVGYNLAISDNESYHENWNGIELSVSQTTYNCYESSVEGGSAGGCIHTWDGDSYSVQDCTTDSKGHEDCTTDWKDRQIPYTNQEMSWIVHTTLGDVTVGDHWLQQDPSAHRVRARDGETHFLSNLPSGTPAFWLAAQSRINAGTPGPVTARRTYSNYILASQDIVLQAHSADISNWRQQKLLPDINYKYNDPYYLNRVYFEGITPTNSSDWQWDLAQFNAVLGETLQGDMYVVLVNSSLVPEGESESYMMALNAWWESPHFGKDDISKNGTVVILGTDGQTIQWAKATTGMPTGNEYMVGDIKDQLPGQALDPSVLLGAPHLVFPVPVVKGHHQYQLDPSSTVGAIGAIVLTGPNHFVRQHMGSYLYDQGQIQPTGGQIAWMLIVLGVISLVVFGVLCYFAAPAYNNWRSPSY